MVILVVKRGDVAEFLYPTFVSESVDKVIRECTEIYNGRLKVHRICYETEELSKYGTALPPEMAGLTEEQVSELGLHDDWAQKCAPSGWVQNVDPLGRRCGRQPPERLAKVMTVAIETARDSISKKHCASGTFVGRVEITKALLELKGAVTIVYPMGLPFHDPVWQELENREELAGMQASLEVLDPATTVMWFCGKRLLPGASISKQLGNNEKCKVVVKLCKQSEGAPAREPVMSEEDRKQLTLHAFRRQEELKDIEAVIGDTESSLLKTRRLVKLHGQTIFMKNSDSYDANIFM